MRLLVINLFVNSASVGNPIFIKNMRILFCYHISSCVS